MGKKALLIGINYIGTRSELRGCINDVYNIKRFLISEKGFKESEIRVMTEATENPNNIPTKANIIAAIQELVHDNNQDSRLFFHYSGHGSWTRDKSGDELDGKDETICPLDYAASGDIIDDDLRKYLVDVLKPGAELFCLFDCCHSGTVLDLKYNYLVDTRPEGTTYTINQDNNYKSSAGQVVVISGCMDNQTSADAHIQNTFQGAMTYSFLKANEILKKANKTVTYKGLMKNLLIVCKEGKYTQVPQICSGKFIDLGSEIKL
jgi:hypothetical protein